MQGTMLKNKGIMSSNYMYRQEKCSRPQLLIFGKHTKMQLK